VQDAKQQKKEIDEVKKEMSTAKNAELAIKKLEALSRLAVTMLKSASLVDGLKNHNPAGEHLGGKVVNLPHGKRETLLVKLLLVEEEIVNARLQSHEESEPAEEDASMQEQMIQDTTATTTSNSNDKIN
jgi:hypothetical protein